MYYAATRKNGFYNQLLGDKATEMYQLLYTLIAKHTLSYLTPLH